MSGGDGKSHNSGAHSTGGVNGSSGKGGPSSGKGGYDGHNLGGHTTNNGNGTSTTTDNRGSITHHTGSGSGSGVHWGGGSGHGNGGGQGGSHSGKVNFSLFPEAQASVAFGAPMNISLIDGMWGFSLLKSTTVQGVIAEALAKVKPLTAPVAGMLWRGGLWGLVIEAVTPTKIAPDDMSMVRHITTTLPASMVTQTPFSQLPTQPAVVADTRVTEVVENGVQKIAVVRTPSIPFGIPTVPAKPTKRPGVYTAAVVEGMPDIHINVGTQSPAAPQKPAEGVQEVRDSQTFQKQPFETGGHTHDAIVYFPPEANTDPVYVSVTPVLTEQQVRELQDEFNRRLAQWDARYPADAAERRAYEAGDKLNREQENVNQKQAALDGIKNTPEGLTLADPAAHPITSTEAKFVAVPTYSGGGVHFDATATVENREQLDQLISLGGMGYLNNVLQWGEVTAPNEDGLKVGNAIKKATAEAYEKLRQRLLDRQNEINNAQAALNTAAESRNRAEQEKKDADSNRDKAKGENKGKPTDFTTDDKIKDQMKGRGWTEQDIKDVIAKGPKGISTDQRSPKKTPPDYLGRNDPATVYGEPGKYVVINDRTREVTQVSDKIKPGWVDDGRIFWGDK